jgi:hypothetical protein
VVGDCSFSVHFKLKFGRVSMDRDVQEVEFTVIFFLDCKVEIISYVVELL